MVVESEHGERTQRFFIKANDAAAAMFEAETDALNTLVATGAIRGSKVISPGRAGV